MSKNKIATDFTNEVAMFSAKGTTVVASDGTFNIKQNPSWRDLLLVDKKMATIVAQDSLTLFYMQHLTKRNRRSAKGHGKK